MSRGAFAEWQPRYAEYGIATFPVRGKVPVVSGYLRLGPSGSRKLVDRFGDASALGIALRRSQIVVVDVDRPDRRILADALARYGPTPFVVRSGSGNFQAWFRRQGEGRHIRPDPTLPIDILGDGFVVVPPSLGENGRYEIIQGSLADLPCLPVLRNPPGPRKAVANASTPSVDAIGPGRRNNVLWQHCMRQAHHCDDFDSLLDVARTANADYVPPLSEDEVMRIALSAWDYTERGENWFGKGNLVVASHYEVDELLHRYPDAYVLLTILRRRHWGRPFVLSNAMAGSMPGGGWTRKRLAAARQRLEVAGKIEMISAACKERGPATYRLKGGQI
jgi:hypothetical protein